MTEEERAKAIEEDVKDGNDYYNRGYTLFEALMMANTTLREEFAIALTWEEEQTLDRIKRSTYFLTSPGQGREPVKVRVVGICTPDTVMVAGLGYSRAVTLKELIDIFNHRSQDPQGG